MFVGLSANEDVLNFPKVSKYVVVRSDDDTNQGGRHDYASVRVQVTTIYF